MFPDVNSVLKLDQHFLAGCRINLVEEEDSLAEFLVHHFVSLGAANKQNVLLIAFEHTFGHYHSVSLKLGENLLKRKESDQLVFFEGLKSVSTGFSGKGGNLLNWSDRPDLGRTFLELRKVYLAMKGGSKNGMIVVDKMTSLLSLGIPLQQVMSFAQNLQALAEETESTLVTLSNGRLDLGLHRQTGTSTETSSDVDADILSTFLGHSSHLNVALWPLPSGKSSNVTGNLTFRWTRNSNPTRNSDSDPTRNNSNSVPSHSGDFQFRIEEKDVKVFALGTSSAVL